MQRPGRAIAEVRNSRMGRVLQCFATGLPSRSLLIAQRTSSVELMSWWPTRGFVPHSGPLAEADDEAWQAAFDVNLRHGAKLASILAPGMAARRDGSIIFTASIAGLRGNKSIGLYGLTKAALTQLARNLAVEWGPENIRANAIAPGLIATTWAKDILGETPAARDRRMSLTPLRRIGQPWEVAAAALFSGVTRRGIHHRARRWSSTAVPSFLTGAEICADRRNRRGRFF